MSVLEGTGDGAATAPADDDLLSSDAALAETLVERSPDIIALLDKGVIRYVSPSVRGVTGWTPEQLVGRRIVDLVHPDDVERAAFDLALHEDHPTAPGYSSYRVRRPGGSFMQFDTTTAEIPRVGTQFMALYARPDHHGSARILDGLLRGASTAETVRSICDVFNWELHGSRVAISWSDTDGVHSVGTDLPAELAGGDDETGTPWARCRNEVEPQRATDLSAVDPARRRLAQDLGLGGYWIEPVVDDDGSACALITVWTKAGGPVPELHALGMGMAKNYVELVVRWARQRSRLHDAAHHDELTGLANRKAFFDLLLVGRPGAVLYCDLDRFKPVNDALGHAAGDELLRAVAARIQAAVRAGDVVARLGGDEFAVLSFGATGEQAVELGRRIRDALVEPFQILGAAVRVGVSVGLAHSSALGEDVLEQADRALYRAKRIGGNAVCGPDECLPGP